MHVTDFDIDGPLCLTPQRFSDERGYFEETFNAKRFQDATGLDAVFVQDNHALSKLAYTVRGLHFQAPPYGQGKLVRCSKGKILDVAVDARQGSSTYGQHVKLGLTPENGIQFWVPAGFLHGYVTLEPDTEVQYKCTNYYHPESDGSVMWNDPELGIAWGFDTAQAIVSGKDQHACTFAAFESPFRF